ncbi:uncharacterized protein LOC108624911 isoform X2 [Ceratina calcarata]|uniref:Uncharacterized protein LOC108624911 isoform X2 n=1 Tax=Ceratina calcarata TaxID=156304 RepID=A0AAJ7IYZ6_9HYME|nr:uncharacterized protein LOC108624911 isoform X2 [Ceratina calcarata]
MTGRFSTTRTGSCLLALFLVSCCLSNDKVFVVGEPEPVPVELYNNNLVRSAADIMLNKLRQVAMKETEEIEEREKDLYDVQVVIKSLETKSEPVPPEPDYSVEELPTPNAVIGQKRNEVNLVTLCHFKICNMGRKRQLRK